MTDKKKSLTLWPETRSITPRDDYVTSPVRERSLMGRVWSRFVAGLNTKTIEANTEEVRALKAYGKERGELADTMLEAERKIAHYVHHRDDIIQDDHEAHHDQMDENRHRRELNRRAHEEAIHAADSQIGQSGMQRDYDQRIAVEANEAALAQAQWQAARARWGKDAFDQSMPFRKERVEHLYKTGALDKEIDRLVAESMRDEQLQSNNKTDSAGSASAADAAGIGTIEQLLAELDQELDNAHAMHAGDEHKAALYGMRARLSAKLAALKGE